MEGETIKNRDEYSDLTPVAASLFRKLRPLMREGELYEDVVDRLMGGYVAMRGICDDLRQTTRATVETVPFIAAVTRLSDKAAEATARYPRLPPHIKG